MLRYWHSKSISLLGISYSILKGSPCYAHSSGGNVDPSGLHTIHNVAKALAFRPTNKVSNRYLSILKNKLGGLHALISQLLDISACGKAGSASFYQKHAHP